MYIDSRHLVRYGIPFLTGNNQVTFGFEIFFVEQCARYGTYCEWQDEIDGKPLDLLVSPPDRTQMITLNGIPTIFGGTIDGDICNSVFEFRNVYDNGSIRNEWQQLEDMKTLGSMHTVLSVPIDFICYQGPTTSITRYVKHLYFVIYGVVK